MNQNDPQSDDLLLQDEGAARLVEDPVAPVGDHGPVDDAAASMVMAEETDPERDGVIVEDVPGEADSDDDAAYELDGDDFVPDEV